MSTNAQIGRLIQKAEAAEQEIMMAVMFHETWKPAAYDVDLHRRMGTSYATNSFSIVRRALRREMLLALMRLWDGDDRAVGMQRISGDLRDSHFFEALVARRFENRRPAIQLGSSAGRSPVGIADAYRATLSERRDEFCALVSKYTKGGESYIVFKKLLILRQVNLAHRQAEPTKAEHADATDAEIEDFYNDNLEIVRLLLSLVLAKAFDLAEACGVYKHHAGFFWAAARGERTEGHPHYRPPIQAVES